MIVAHTFSVQDEIAFEWMWARATLVCHSFLVSKRVVGTLATIGIGVLLYRMAEKPYHKGLLWSIAIILAGAIGNVIDSTFYGALLENAPYDAVTPWFHGQVIDMFYLDLWEGYVANWVPFWGGKRVSLLPIFNLADVAIFIGVLIVLLFQKRFFEQNWK